MNDGVSSEVSREKLEQELKGIEDAIEELDDRVSDLEDKDMMAELETLSIEEEVQEVEEMLNHMDKEELERRLNIVEQIKEEYQEGKVHEKLEYLYEQIKELKQQKAGEQNPENPGEVRNKVEKLEDKIERLEDKIGELEQMKSPREEETGLESLVQGSSRFETEQTNQGEVVKLK